MVPSLPAGLAAIGDTADGMVAGAIATATAMKGNTRFCRLATAQPEIMWTSRNDSNNWLARTEHSVWGTRRSALIPIEGFSRLSESTREAEMGGPECSNTQRAVRSMVQSSPAGAAVTGDEADGMAVGAITITITTITTT